MGHQVNFYATPTDILELERRIGLLEPRIILHSESPTSQPRIVPSLGVMDGSHRWLSYYLVRDGDLERVVTRHVPAQKYWVIDVSSSPVVEFRGCYFDGKILRLGRVYYVDGDYGADDAWVEKSESFRTWAKKVLRTTKKALKKRGPDYIGEDALAWLEREQGELDDEFSKLRKKKAQTPL